MSKNAQHVAPRGDKWTVRRAGTARASGIFATQGEAIAKAREIAKRQKTDLFIHGTDGRIKERQSYVVGGRAADAEG